MVHIRFVSRVLPSLTVVCIAVASQVSCSKEKKPTPPNVPVETANMRAQVLQAVGQCAQDSNKTFESDAATLSQSVSAWRDESGDPATLAAARDAFRAALRSWQVLELMRFGPLARPSEPGGQDIRDNIYSWPITSRCAVEEQIVSQSYQTEGFSSAQVNRRGLDALEYLLFFEGEDTACGASSPIVAGGTWAALSAEERAARKRAYAAVVAADVHARATQLVQAWESGFLSTLTTAADGNQTFASSQAALNAISDALLVADSELKDAKLAVPAGLRDCATATCPEELESRFAGLSKENIRSNLVGLRKVLEGCGEDFSGTGFDDLLTAVNGADTAEALRVRMGEALAAVDAIEEADLSTALANDVQSVVALHSRVKGVTDILKTEFLTILDLELPQTLEGDND